jgi:hypothetical protein
LRAGAYGRDAAPNLQPDRQHAAFALADWQIIYVETPDTDSPFLFFHGDPLGTHFVTLWAGAARSQEEGAIKAWVIKNASGIPESLATCFAWYVTKVRNR